MKSGRAFTLVEALLATVLLAALVTVCLSMMRSPEPTSPAPVHDPRLAVLAATSVNRLTSERLQRADSVIGRNTTGQWVVVESGERYTVVWVADDRVLGAEP